MNVFRNINAQYVALYRKHNGEVPMAEFTHLPEDDSVYDNLSEHDKRIVDEVTRHEQEDGMEWNEGTCCDFESAMEALIQMMDCTMGGKYLDSEDNIRWCSHCGMPMQEGYYLDGEYACCDKCRNFIYIKHGAKSAKEAEDQYLTDYKECDNDYYWTKWY